ncbi:MAG: OmpA family protein [Thermodesulfobacteriota bacterium]
MSWSSGRIRILVRRLVPLLLVLLTTTGVQADDCRRLKDLLILFDASGFMKDQDRFKGVLEHMEYFKQAMPLTADGFFNVGIRHYGLKVGMQCNSTELILGMQPWDPERFINSFPKTVSYGTGALSAGLRAAADDLAAIEGPAMLLVIGGGMESCKMDPVRITEQICFNNPNLEIHTFQLGNEQEGRFNLRDIAKKGRGTYNHLREIGGQAGWFAWMKRHLVVPCAGPAAPGAPAQPVQPLPEVGPVTFDPGSFSVKSKDRNADAANLISLNAVGNWLRNNPQARVNLHGFSDAKGSPQQNLKNSGKQAEAVSQFLTSTYGIDPSRIGVVAHGMTRALSQGMANQNQRMARRVMFELIQQ